ncbi:type IV secretory system conjugative DNA transfer family protein [Maribius pontilimi]|uniref:Type IV secretory system conjugative DNA transfer family protein n=1 Tax=Palleronia pontilimi TaxID=1964209 RepID=A0A934MIJ9_9RHOB|nr:type IV secretory system conjugative DNA transfer family protein [Palleronia pontilimi]MBJ3764329.1 type IV secretory system conjugative DNA transfer family protein [Palleronia pontilimi]
MQGVLLFVGGVARVFVRVIVTPILLGWLVGAMAFGAMLGALAGFVLSTPFFDMPPGQSPWEWVIYGPCILIGALLGVQYWRMVSGADVFFGLTGDSHGSARFASRKELKKHEGGEGLLIGRNPGTGRLLRYDGPAHLITLAPTRAGTGVGTVIPNLLAVERSVLVIDPKGENARIAGAARRRFGTVHILDPFQVSGLPSAAYNPLDRLTPDSLDLGEDAASLTEALVMDPAGQVQEAHWNEEAKALLGGLIMFCVCHEENDRRSLATIREYLTLPPDRLRALLELMQESDAAGGLIARAANRFLGKADREAASVLSNAQRHTHFLDSPRIARCMARSDFAFADLRHRVTSVFLVLPPNRMDAYSRWLRLLVSQALQDIARDAEVSATPAGATGAPAALSGPTGDPGASPARSDAPATPLSATGRLKAPALFLLDEFAALGRLEAVERAMGLMAGYGLQLWPILQDMSQLRDLYGDRANTFIANAGVQQVFGVNDFETAKWLSQMIGQETRGYQTDSFKPGDGPSFSNHLTGRDLLTPDEILQMPPELELLRVQGEPSALAQKLRYYADPEFRGLFVPQDA